jgi:3-hydroxyacyl-[acyl-carrier-protein] dehydratase
MFSAPTAARTSRLHRTASLSCRVAQESERLPSGSAYPPPTNDDAHMALADSDALIEQLPHRPPFLFVDVVDLCDPAVRVEARYLVTGEEAFLGGHFPGNPIMPGVLQLEALAQAGAIALLSDGRYAGRLPLFGGVEKVRFRRVVRPGEELSLVVDIERLSARGGWAQARASVVGETACEARMFFAVT